MQYMKVSGPFSPCYPGIVRKLNDSDIDHLGFCLYIIMATLFQMEEDWDQDSEWVSATILATKTDIINESSCSRSGFYHSWKQLIKSGLVVEQDNNIILPFFKRKSDESISPREIRRRFQNISDETERIKKFIYLFSDLLTDKERQLVFTAFSDPEVFVHRANVFGERTYLRYERTPLTRAGTINEIKENNKREEEEPDPSFDENLTDNGEPSTANSDFIIFRARQLWPGLKIGDVDSAYIAQIGKYPKARVVEAFDAAEKSEIRYSNWTWLINRLRQPGYYTQEGKKKRREQNTDIDEDIAALPDNWLEDESEE